MYKRTGKNVKMCESSVFVERGGKRELLMEDVVHVAVATGNGIKLTGILGETREAQGRITEINLLTHTIVITA